MGINSYGTLINFGDEDSDIENNVNGASRDSCTMHFLEE